jgi:hypothetical protein
LIELSFLRFGSRAVFSFCVFLRSFRVISTGYTHSPDTSIRWVKIDH